MDILIINPPTFSKSYGDYAEAGGKNQPLGLCYIAAILEKKGISIDLLDADVLNLNFEQTIKEIKKINPKIILLTVTTPGLKGAIKLSKKIKKDIKGIKIIIGGPHLAIDAEDTMKIKYFDYGVIGEAEYTILELVKNILGEKDISNIKGIIYREKNKIKRTPPRELIEDLNELPMPAYHLLPNIRLYHPQIHAYRYSPIITMITSRGCPYRCIFCDKGVFGKRFRYINGGKIVDQIEILQNKYGIKEVMFVDDLFTINKTRIIDMCNEIKRRKIKIAWSCSTRADLLDQKLLTKMKGAGCWMIALGIESGNQRILNFIKKDIQIKKIKKVVEIANSLNIKVRAYFQIGNPTETKEEIEETIKFANSLNIFTAEFTIATPFKGTEFYEIAKDYGSFNTNDTSKISQMFPVFVAKGLTKEYLEEKQKEAHRKFYLRPKKIWEFISMIRSPKDIIRYYKGAKILLTN